MYVKLNKISDFQAGTYYLKENMKLEEIINFTLPQEESKRNIAKIKKEKITPECYPRRYDKIVKSPLK